MNNDLSPGNGAALLLTWLQTHGAHCVIDADGFLQVDLNPVADIRDHETAEGIANAVLALREEIKALIRSEKVRH